MDDVSNLAALRTTPSNAAEIIAALIGTAKDGNQPIESLLAAAERSLADLVQWEDTIAGVIEITERTNVH